MNLLLPYLAVSHRLSLITLTPTPLLCQPSTTPKRNHIVVLEKWWVALVSRYVKWTVGLGIEIRVSLALHAELGLAPIIGYGIT